ncbi:MAG: L,D-transpeptidase family protein [Pseudomonadota bacterium]|nr:L,D-transpeptidase family protein [Pseudomonadota bacterium]
MTRARGYARRAGWLAAVALVTWSPVAASAATQQAPDSTAAADGAVAAAIRASAPAALEPFYRQRGFWPLWSRNGLPAPQAAALVDLVDTVAVDGLDPDRYDPSGLRRQLAAAQAGNPAAMARADIALSAALAALVSDMRRPRIDLRYVDPGLEPAKPDAIDVLRRAALVPSLAAYVRGLEWMSPFYVGLRRALAGQPDLAAPRIAPRVALRQYEPATPPRIELDRSDRSIFGAPYRSIPRARVTEAKPVSDVGAERIRLLRLNLERARLLPGPWTPHIVVDTATARLWYVDGGAQQGTMKVIVGTPATPTPTMAGMVRYATLNPYWNVPTSLVRKNIAPKVVAGASLSSLGYELLSNWSADARVIDARSVDWRKVAAGDVEVRVRELPGNGNSMGTVKYQFPNDDGIYLHDTPNRALFAKDDRHFSNGCVRLEDAPRLGRWLVGKTLHARSSDPEQVLALLRPVPIYLLYFTALPTDDGVAYAADPYRRDDASMKQLAAR